jgi:DNA-binding transcriptional LysR family regulator
MIASYYLPHQIVLQNADPRPIEITIRDTTRELIAMLEEGRLDLALVQDFPAHGLLKSVHLFNEPYVAVLPETHPLAQKPYLGMTDLVKAQMIIHKAPCDIRNSFRRYCNRLGIEPSDLLKLEFNDSIVTFVAKGHGVSVVPKMVADQLHDLPIVAKELTDLFARTIHAVFLPEKEMDVRSLLSLPGTVL